jgi:type IV secretion system protein VirB10
MADQQQPLSPPLPRAVRISRRALWAILAVVALTVFGASLALNQKTAAVAERPQEAPAPPLRSATPSFLERQPLPPRGAVPGDEPLPLASPEELRRAQEAGFIDDYLPAPPEASAFPPPDLATSEQGSASARDPRAEAFRRALEAPSLVEPASSGSRPTAPRPEATGLAGELGLGDTRGLAPPQLPSARELLVAAQGARPPAAEPQPASFPPAASAPHRLSFEPPARHVLPAGSTIPAVLETGLNSDLTGDLAAQVTLDVYDRSHREVLIPRGSRLLGTYQNRVAAGQDRLVVAWTRLVLPDGRGLTFPGLPGVSPAGEAGLRGRVDGHLARVFGHAVLLSLVSAGAQLGQPQESATFGQAASARQLAAGALAGELSTVATEILRRGLNVQPTITVPPGTSFHVYVASDLVFPEPYRS